MKNFNWEEFKKGNIAVHCDTEEKAKDFLKECDKNDIKWETGEYTHESTEWNEHKKETSYSHYIKGVVIARLGLNKALGYKIIEWEIEDMKELTFTEVIANKKEGQVWECTREDARLKTINIKEGSIVFIYKDGSGVEVFGVRETDTFILRRKEYTFQEAFKAYEEGKEIESVSSGCRYKKEKGKGKDTYMYLADWMEFDSIELEEIRGKWYINDQIL
ncbi:hypothetical protein [uncultured Clostridium sp.]|uniref:hypothetical protein n=1 Tax=uncultured Clostridium sp. TaxID=59620 RepID=UPI00280C09AE|nr:hypothetical protein [uncultured Clostridium sp.]